MIISFRETREVRFHSWAILSASIAIQSISVITPFFFRGSDSVPTLCDTCRRSINNLTIKSLYRFAFLIASFWRIAFFLSPCNFIPTDILKFTNAFISLIYTFPFVLYLAIEASIILVCVPVLTFILYNNHISTFGNTLGNVIFVDSTFVSRGWLTSYTVWSNLITSFFPFCNTVSTYKSSFYLTSWRASIIVSGVPIIALLSNSKINYFISAFWNIATSTSASTSPTP